MIWEKVFILFLLMILENNIKTLNDDLDSQLYSLNPEINKISTPVKSNGSRIISAVNRSLLNSKSKVEIGIGIESGGEIRSEIKNVFEDKNTNIMGRFGNITSPFSNDNNLKSNSILNKNEKNVDFEIKELIQNLDSTIQKINNGEKDKNVNTSNTTLKDTITNFFSRFRS